MYIKYVPTEIEPDICWLIAKSSYPFPQDVHRRIGLQTPGITAGDAFASFATRAMVFCLVRFDVPTSKVPKVLGLTPTGSLIGYGYDMDMK